MPHIVDWPANLKPIDATIPHLIDSATSSGPTIVGKEAVVEGLAARWAYQFSFKLWTREERLSWRALHGLSGGRASIIRVPICDCRDAPRYAAPYAHIPTQVTDIPYSETGPPYSNEVYHSDGSGFQQDGTASTLDANYVAGATSLRLKSGFELDIYPGHFFSLDDRLYLVKSVSKIDPLTLQIEFAPRLRKPAFAGSHVSFAKLYCLMRLTDDSALKVDLSLKKFGNHSIEFQEAVL